MLLQKDIVEKIQLKCIDGRLGKEFPLPEYTTSGAAGMDICACLQEPLVLEPNTSSLIPSGFAIHIEDANLAAMLLPRSGLGHKKGIVLGNLVGLRVPPKMSFFRDSGVSSVLESSCIVYTFRHCARCFLALTKKILISEVLYWR